MSRVGAGHGEVVFFCWVLQEGGTMLLGKSATASLTSCTVSNSSGKVRKHALEALDEQDGVWAW